MLAGHLGAGQVAQAAEGHGGHRFGATGDDHVFLTRGDFKRPNINRFEARAAEPVDRHARHGDRQATHQGNIAAHVHALFGLGHGATHDHIAHAGRIQVGVVGQQLPDHRGAQVIGAGVAQGAFEGSSDGGAAGADYDDFSIHLCLLLCPA